MFSFKISDQRQSLPADSWVYAGTTSSFPDIASLSQSNSDSPLVHSISVPCIHNDNDSNATETPAAKIFSVPKPGSSSPGPTQLSIGEAQASADLKDQVLIFQHRGNFHAVDHRCPHSSFPLSQGTIHDIEDFGVVLSAGITCSKHGWSFDLHTGQSDRGNYKLHIWDVELRELKTQNSSQDVHTVEKEVWVRRKKRFG